MYRKLKTTRARAGEMAAPVCWLVLSSVALQLPRLHDRALAPLFGPNQFVAVPNFLSPELVSALASDARSLRATLKPATAAPAHGSVEWLELQPTAPPSHDDTLGLAGRECMLAFMDDLRRQIEDAAGLQLDAPTSLKYAHYPCGGHYQRHVDGMNTGRVAREFSFLLYLNEGWSPSDGGHLRVFALGGEPGPRDIAPAAGTLVVFKSDVVPHEVRPTTARRLAVVGWFHRHVEPPIEVDEAALSPLARAIAEHYRAQGQGIKLEGAPSASNAASLYQHADGGLSSGSPARLSP